MSAAAKHTLSAINASQFPVQVTAQYVDRFVQRIVCSYFALTYVPSIEPLNHLSELCRPSDSNGEKARHLPRSLRVPFSFGGQRLMASASRQPRAPATGSRTVSRSNVMVNLARTPDCGRQLCRRLCRELAGCTLNNYPPKTPNRAAFVAPLFFMPVLPNYRASPFHHFHLVTVPLHLRHSSTTDSRHYPSQQPTSQPNPQYASHMFTER
jgi:hypothetical protein